MVQLKAPRRMRHLLSKPAHKRLPTLLSNAIFKTVCAHVRMLLMLFLDTRLSSFCCTHSRLESVWLMVQPADFLNRLHARTHGTAEWPH